MMNKVLTKSVNRILKSRGFEGYGNTLMVNALKKDIMNKDVPIFTKLWAWKRGFLGTRVHRFNINESNYKNHMPDFDYYKLHPINGSYGRWIDDKLTMKYVLAPFNEFIPKYYFQIEDNQILRLMDAPDDITTDISGIVELLKIEKDLALKLLSGSLGAGFYRVSYKNDHFYINGEEKELSELEVFVKSLKGYLVTEYIVAHKDIREIYDVTPNTLRVQTIKDENDKPSIIGSFMRFGTKKSGILELIDAGSVMAGVGLENGLVFDPVIAKDNKLVRVDLHPDTNENMEIVLPHWDEIKQKVIEISNYVPSLTYLGFDIIITENSFKIIEINSLSAAKSVSYHNPFFENDHSKKFFTRKFKENPKHFKRVLKMLGD